MLIASETTYHHLDKVIAEILANGFVSSWKTSLLYQKILPWLLHNRLVFTWGDYLFGVESWYMNLIGPMLTTLILLVIFYFVNKQDKSMKNRDSLVTANSPSS
jgi:hypothetical protein